MVKNITQNQNKLEDMDDIYLGKNNNVWRLP